MSRPINILHVTTGMGEGGAEALLSRLIANTDKSRARHHLLSLSQEGPLWAPTVRLCASALNLRLDRGISSLPRLTGIAGFMRNCCPDIVQGWMYHGNLAASWLRRWFTPDTPLVFGIRQSLYDIGNERPLTRSVIRAGARRSGNAAAVIYNSAVARGHHSNLGYRDDQGLVIPNGFDASRFAPSPSRRSDVRARLGLDDSEFVVAMVGRFHPVKDHATFIRASAIVALEKPYSRFLVVGPGCTSRNVELAELVRRLGGSARFEFLGAWQDTSDLYPALDALCLTSIAEGFPNVVGEAMSSGVVCVCTNVGDIPSLVGDTGYLASPGDANGIASGLLRVCSLEPSRKDQAAASARQRIVEKFSIEDMIRSYMKLYEQLVAVPAAGRPRQ